MKRFLKIVFTIICWIGAIFLLVQVIKEFRNLDPWGLGLTFYILPMGILGVAFLIVAIILTKKLITNKKQNISQ